MRAVARRLISSSTMPPMTSLSNPPPAFSVAGGKGVRVSDESGRTFLEGMSGLWCTSLGWGNEELIETTAEQMRELSYYHSFSGRRVPVADQLAEKLIEVAPPQFAGGKVFFGQSGSDANDTQVRLLWMYNRAIGRPEKRKVISRLRGYHGVTCAAGSLTGLPYVGTPNALGDESASGLPLDFVPRHVTCPSHYRDGREGEDEAKFVARLAAELDSVIEAEGPSTVAAFIAEPIQGAGGVIAPPAGYFEAIRKVPAKHEVLMIGDEVICGFGRCGTMWGAEAVGQTPDLISCAKQLTSGYVPLSAVLLPAHMHDTIAHANGASGAIFGHGYTYTGHPVSCAVALKVLEITARDNLVQRVADTLGPHFQRRLRQLEAHPLVGEARGAGLLGGLELVEDKPSRMQFAPSRAAAPKVVAAAFEHGLILRPLTGDVVAVCPPLVITLEEVDEIFDKLEAALDDTLDALG